MNGLPAASFSMTGLRCFTPSWADSVPVCMISPAARKAMPNATPRYLMRLASAMSVSFSEWNCLSAHGSCRPLPFKALTEHLAKLEGAIRPVAVSRRRRPYLLRRPAQPKHDVGPFPLGHLPLRHCFLPELLFQAGLEP